MNLQRIKIIQVDQHHECITVHCADSHALVELNNQEFCVHSAFEQVINLQRCKSAQLICFSSKYLARYTLQVSQATLNSLKRNLPSLLYIKVESQKPCALSSYNSSFILGLTLEQRLELATSLEQLILPLPDLHESLLELSFQKYIQNPEILISNLVGLGHGLTPSGDDFIVGYLCASHAMHYDISNIVNFLNLHATRLTNQISASYLQNAAQGLFPQPLLELVSTSNAQQFLNQADYIINNIGSTSGRDLILGIIALLKSHKLITPISDIVSS